MRILYIAGFFAPVLTEIQKGAESYLNERSVVWIQQRRDKKNQLDLNQLRADLLDQAKRGATDIHICCHVFRDQEHLIQSLDGIKDWAIARHPGINITIERFKNARDSAGVLDKIRDFKPSRKIALPESLASIQDWTDKHCGGHVTLHQRAVRGANESVYADVELVYHALKLLAEEYWNLRTATPETRDSCSVAFQSKLDSHGLELSASISDSRAGEQGEEYRVIYPIGGQLKRDLELHLKKGSDRDPRNCLRIYFFWDATNRTTVVGWLTSHLATRGT